MRAKGSSLPCGRYLLAPLTGNKEGSKGLMVLRVRPTPTRFPVNNLCTGSQQIGGSNVRSLFPDQSKDFPQLHPSQPTFRIHTIHEPPVITHPAQGEPLSAATLANPATHKTPDPNFSTTDASLRRYHHRLATCDPTQS